MTDIHEMMSVDPPDEKNGGRKLTRGEKSKIAAKGRRDKEHIAMLDLMKELPVSMDILEKMDKAAVVKLATYYIKMKHFIQKDLSLYGFKALPDVKESAQDIGPNSVTKFQDQPTNLPESQMMLEALNGFLIFVSKKGSVKFVSNTVQDHLGHKQESLFGKSIYDFIHPNDHHELSKQFEDDQKNSSVKLSTMFLPADEPRRVFYVRMKFSLPKPNSKVKNTGYMLVQWSGKMKRHISTKLGCLVNLGLICICRPMQTTPLLEIRMDGSMFMSRHDLGMTFTFCDSRIITLIGYEPNELLGKTAYHFHNPIDAPKVQACHQNLIVKGTSVSKYYRFLGKNDNWVWLQTRATIIYNTSNVAQYIVCMNFVISEEEGEKYLMLEEHQQANHHSASCVITLPDNPRSYTDCRVKINGGVKIVELQDENLEKTACLNGELDTQPKPIHSSTHLASISGGSQELSTNSNNMVLPEAGYQGTLMVPVPSTSQEVSPGPTLPGSQCMTPTVFESVSQCQTMIPEHNMVTQCSPMMSCGSTDNISMSVETTNRIDPLVPEYMSHGSPESACSVYAGSPQPQAYTGSSHLSHTGSLCSNGFIDRTMDNFSQTMGASCSSSHSDDAGYESANSPYTTSYLSPQTVSSACSYDSSDRGYTADITNHSVLNQGQGQTCSYGGGFLMDSTMNLNDETLASHHSMDDGNCDYSNPVLDEIFKSMNQPNSDNLSVNMALVFSTIESLTSQSPLSVSTKVKSPGTPGVLNGSKVSSASVSQPERRTDKPLLRSFLTMPQDDIPKQPLGFLQMCKNNGQGKKSMNKNNRSLPYGIDKQKDPSAQKTAKMNQMSAPHATVSNTVLNNCVGGHTESIDSEQLELTAFPDEFHDFALQNLVNDITDAQAQALIADLQNEVGDTLMDTSEYLENLDDSCTNAGTSTGSSHNFLSNGVGSVSSVTSTIPLSQCKTSINSYSSSDRNKCTTSTSTQQLQHSDPCFGNGPMYPVNGRPNKTAHDHVYHQSLNRLNGQTRQKFNNKCPGNRAQFANNRLNGRQIPNMCQSQSQTSDHCKSELERHLRNRLKSRGQNCFGGHSMYNNEDKPFLQQLLTGELTNDMYIMMEKRRFEEKPIRPQ